MHIYIFKFTYFQSVRNDRYCATLRLVIRTHQPKSVQKSEVAIECEGGQCHPSAVIMQNICKWPVFRLVFEALLASGQAGWAVISRKKTWPWCHQQQDGGPNGNEQSGECQTSATRLGAAAQHKATCIAQGKGSCSLAISRTEKNTATPVPTIYSNTYTEHLRFDEICMNIFGLYLYLILCCQDARPTCAGVTPPNSWSSCGKKSPVASLAAPLMAQQQKPVSSNTAWPTVGAWRSVLVMTKSPISNAKQNAETFLILGFLEALQGDSSSLSTFSSFNQNTSSQKEQSVSLLDC